MRPITLTISAFGPYADKTELNFADLKNQRLFVITGATGSGKTTIFEAILYALYGKLSKQGMDPSSLRCDFLKPDDNIITYVDYVFEIGNKQYKIHRQPKQFVAKKRGDGFKEIGQEVMLECVNHNDFLPLSKISEVDKKIVELVGLEEEQFKKIVMLPQGAFQEFLVSNTKDKIELLRNIFNTEIYDLALQNIKNRVSSINDDYEQMKISYQTQVELLKLDEKITSMDISETTIQHIENLVGQEKKDLAILSTEVGKSFQSYHEAVERYNNQKQHNTDVETLSAVEKERSILISQQTTIKEIEARLEAIDRVVSVSAAEKRFIDESRQLAQQEKKVQISQATLNNAIQSYNDLNREYLDVCEQKKIAFKAAEQLPELENRLNCLKDYQGKFNLLIEGQKQFSISNNILEQKRSVLDQITSEKKAAEKKRDEKYNIITIKDRKGKELNDLERELEQERGNYKTVKTYSKKLSDKKTCMIAMKEEQAEKDQAKFAFEEAKKQNQNHLAASLAKNLTEGMPCPVCGAIHHPDIVIDSGWNSEENRLEELFQGAQKKYIATEEKLKLIENDITSICTEVVAISDTLLDEQAAENYLGYVVEQGKIKRNKAEYLKEELQQLEQDLNVLENIDQTLDTLGKQYEQINNEMLHWTGVAQQQQGEINNLQMQVESLQNTHQFSENDDVRTYENQIAKIKLEQDNITKAVDEKLRMLQASELNKNTEQTNLNLCIERLNELKNNVEAFKLDFENNLNNQFNSKDAYIQAKNDVAKKDALQSQVVEYTNKCNKNQANYDFLVDRLKDNRVVYDLTTASTACETFKNNYENVMNIHSMEEAKLSSNENIVAKMKEIWLDFCELEKKHTVLGSLYDLLSGKNISKMRFETFAQAYYFERMLDYANQRLTRMTNKRYSFRRKEVVNDARKQAGLDLDIMDQYTGKARDVSTLSGGESFKASLSLALGLADVVSSENGGVELSTIFIDEGFGTLDEESLDDTVETLLSLQDSGRLVGVISHVAELKERIPAHLMVSSGKNGSHAHFEVKE